MKTIRGLILTFTALTFIFAAGGVYAESKTSDKESDGLFQVLDKNKDGKITRDEWDAMDASKDGKIIPEELERFHFKSSRTVRWIDTNGDGYMDRREFQDNFRR
ncbi:MAG TPA: EF-hand domain-containing protein [Thermodesulfovibrionales bacterium]|nr:EF-hand domain-containing protein [Thermodesulfovibrionales bacterium]